MINKSRTIGQNLGKLSNRMRRRLASLSIPGNYSGAQERTLHFILANMEYDIFQKDIEEEFGLRPSTATELLKSMEQAGLITRIPLEHDGRFKKIVPSEKALQYKDIVLGDLEEFERQLAKDISKEDLEVFNRVIKKMINNIE